MQAQSLLTDTIGGKVLAKGSPEYAEAEKYMNDRFTKARNVIDLIQTKLPDYASPYALQMGERISRILYTLGEVTGNKDDTARANKIMEAELLRYGQYARFFQTLTPSQYNLLSSPDMYADVYYIMELLQLYNMYNPDNMEAMVAKLEAEGVDISRLIARYPKDSGQ